MNRPLICCCGACCIDLPMRGSDRAVLILSVYDQSRVLPSFVVFRDSDAMDVRTPHFGATDEHNGPGTKFMHRTCSTPCRLQTAASFLVL